MPLHGRWTGYFPPLIQERISPPHYFVVSAFIQSLSPSWRLSARCGIQILAQTIPLGTDLLRVIRLIASQTSKSLVFQFYRDYSKSTACIFKHNMHPFEQDSVSLDSNEFSAWYSTRLCSTSQKNEGHHSKKGKEWCRLSLFFVVSSFLSQQALQLSLEDMNHLWVDNGTISSSKISQLSPAFRKKITFLIFSLFAKCTEFLLNTGDVWAKISRTRLFVEFGLCIKRNCNANFHSTQTRRKLEAGSQTLAYCRVNQFQTLKGRQRVNRLWCFRSECRTPHHYGVPRNVRTVLMIVQFRTFRLKQRLIANIRGTRYFALLVVQVPVIAAFSAILRIALLHAKLLVLPVFLGGTISTYRRSTYLFAMQQPTLFSAARNFSDWSYCSAVQLYHLVF